jgi:hypothetical protein
VFIASVRRSVKLALLLMPSLMAIVWFAQIWNTAWFHPQLDAAFITLELLSLVALVWFLRHHRIVRRRKRQGQGLSVA